jgi:hypothetical protein
MLVKIEQPTGILIENVDAFQPPIAKLKSILDQISKACDVKFSDLCDGNNDERTIFYPFTEELSEEKFEQVETFLETFKGNTPTVEDLLDQLATTLRTGCHQLLGRDFTDDEKVTLSRGYEALDTALKDILLGKPVAFTE